MKKKRQKTIFFNRKFPKEIPTGTVYGLGFIGAVIYFLSISTSFWIGVLGIMKAMIWPVFIVLELFRLLMAA